MHLQHLERLETLYTFQSWERINTFHVKNAFRWISRENVELPQQRRSGRPFGIFHTLR